MLRPFPFALLVAASLVCPVFAGQETALEAFQRLHGACPQLEVDWTRYEQVLKTMATIPSSEVVASLDAAETRIEIAPAPAPAPGGGDDAIAQPVPPPPEKPACATARALFGEGGTLIPGLVR